MVNIKFHPTRSDTMPQLDVSVKGDVVTINGEVFDFSPLKDGDSLPRAATGSEHFVGVITKTGEDLNIELLMPYRWTEDSNILFPVDLSIKSGTVKVPTDTQREFE